MSLYLNRLTICICLFNAVHVKMLKEKKGEKIHMELNESLVDDFYFLFIYFIYYFCRKAEHA